MVSGQSLFETIGWHDDGHPLDGTFRMTVPRPEEFGATCAFLCSEAAGYINAQNILVDGGAYQGVV